MKKSILRIFLRRGPFLKLFLVWWNLYQSVFRQPWPARFPCLKTYSKLYCKTNYIAITPAVPATWLPVSKYVQSKTLLLSYKGWKGTAPLVSSGTIQIYISTLSNTPISLHYLTTCQLHQVLWTVPALWNPHPQHIRNTQTKTELKSLCVSIF